MSFGAFSIFFDVVILCLPIPMIKSLRVNLKQKISILAIFWLGGFVCVAAVIRLIYLVQSMGRLNGKYGQNSYSLITFAFIWAEIEPNVAVITACLPTYGPIFTDNKFAAMVQSFKSMLGFPTKTKTATTSQPSRFSNTKRSSYYELDKTINSKTDAGDILSERGSRSIALKTEISIDTEAQKSLDGGLDRDGIPKAWIRR